MVVAASMTYDVYVQLSMRAMRAYAAKACSMANSQPGSGLKSSSKSRAPSVMRTYNHLIRNYVQERDRREKESGRVVWCHP